MKGCDAPGFDNGLNQSGYHYGEAGDRTLITSLEKCYKEVTDWYDGLKKAGIK